MGWRHFRSDRGQPKSNVMTFYRHTRDHFSMPSSLCRLPIGMVAAAVVFLAALLHAPSALAQYPLTSGSLAVSNSGSPERPLPPGTPVALSGGGFRPGADVEIWLHSDPIYITSVNATGAGNIDVSVKIPADAPAGRHNVEARGAAPGGGTVVLRAPVLVAASTTATHDGGKRGVGGSSSSGTDAAGELPFTGFSVLLVLAAGTVMLIGGVTLSKASRRRG